LLACLLLCACATSTRSGRAQLSVPTPVSAAYSEIDMRLQLATAAVVESRRAATDHALDEAFDRRVQRLGAQLAQTAFAAYPDLGGRVDRFEFLVADNNEPGTASSVAGTVAIFRGVQHLGLDDEALSFVIAREMGHVIDGHNDENSAASILFSVLIQALLPVTNLLGGASVISDNAIAAATTTTAASFVGSRALRASNRPDQMREADDLALDLLARQGRYGREVAKALLSSAPTPGINDWADDLRDSTLRVDQLVQGPPHYAMNMDDVVRAPPTFEIAATPILVGTASPTQVEPAPANP